MKISSLEIENVKRVRAVHLEPAANGLTVIGGKNGQGKTSVLDAIAWALGGEKYRPSAPQREGAALGPRLKVVLDNGLVVERKGRNSALTVTDPAGRKGGQQLLDAFVEQFAIDLPRFLRATDRDKAAILLRTIGVEEELARLEGQESAAYSKRRTIGQIAKQKEQLTQAMPEYPDAPDAQISVLELIHRQQQMLKQNAENQRMRDRVKQMEEQVQQLAGELEALFKRHNQAQRQLEDARAQAQGLKDQDAAALEREIARVEAVNARVRANMDKAKAAAEAADYAHQYEALSGEIEALRAEKRALLEKAALPLPELTVEGGQLMYRGHAWDCLSGADQLMVATAIVRALNPQCRFVLLDKLEQMDLDTLKDFGEWLEREGLQAIATRVSTGEECQIIIEDGVVVNPAPSGRWKAGEF